MAAAGKSEDFLNNDAGAGQFSRATHRRPSAIQISANGGDFKPIDKKDVQRSEFSVAPSGDLAYAEATDMAGKSKPISVYSYGTDSSGANGHGKELVETLYFKLKGVKWNMFSIVNNIILLVILDQLYTEKGLFFNIGPYLFIHA
jgi:hypothetical protein